MMERLLFLLSGISMIVAEGVTSGDVTVTQVPAGHLAELPCLSNDDYHRFSFWQLTDNRKIIGPGNSFNEEKYNYEVLSGKLMIRGVSSAESGFYKCVSRGVTNVSKMNTNIVELVVTKGEWETAPENNFETNLLRGMAAVMILVVGIAVILFIITTKRRRQRFFDLEESRENSPARYKENPQSVPASPAPHPNTETSGIDNIGLDVDFPKVFQQMRKEQGLP